MSFFFQSFNNSDTFIVEMTKCSTEACMIHAVKDNVHPVNVGLHNAEY